jgi:hypothetical protein
VAWITKLTRIYHSGRITRRSEILSGWPTTLKQIEHNNEIIRSTLGGSAKCRRLFRRRSGLRSQRRHCSSAIRRSGTISFSANHFQVFLDEYCTNLVTSAVIFSPILGEKRLSIFRLARSLVLISDHQHLTSFISVSCALSLLTGAPQLLWNQFVPHSFYRNGGCTPLTLLPSTAVSSISPISRRPSHFSSTPYRMLLPQPLCFDSDPFSWGVYPCHLVSEDQMEPSGD